VKPVANGSGTGSQSLGRVALKSEFDYEAYCTGPRGLRLTLGSEVVHIACGGSVSDGGGSRSPGTVRIDVHAASATPWSIVLGTK
jgi:hypothetical protein